ncbi:hypothetical protein [Streptomyces griseus]|uniref:hypothetical protein n=1 Tax=Streptomyces griseus TaxID=1911 RepID=UPI000840918B|nr:hypothetical protein [Streptomyces griseus]
MADERDEWLDADAAECLLRGESVEPVDDHARSGSRRLEAALRGVRTPRPSGAELPGEAAALAAFRVYRAGGRDAVSPEAPAGRRDAPQAVRIGATRTAPSRRPRWTRPVRYGLAVSLAGCALGGVAVAGGTGMLPVPFGGHDGPAPAASVSAAASPEEQGADASAPAGASARPSGPPGVSDPPGARSTDGPAGPDAEEPGPGHDPAGPGQDTGTPEAGPDPDGSRGTGEERGLPDASAGERAAEAYAKSVRACRAYRDDDLSRAEKRRLAELAQGERNLERFCDRVLGRGSGSGSDGADNGGDGNGSGGAEGDSGADSGRDAGGPLPSVSFRTSPPPSGAERGADPDADAGATSGAEPTPPPVPVIPAR